MPAIHGLNKTTLLDYPGKVAATIFLGSCNFRCPFCQNSSLVLHPADEPVIPEEEVLSFLKNAAEFWTASVFPAESLPLLLIWKILSAKYMPSGILSNWIPTELVLPF